jgi:hypothetical protein
VYIQSSQISARQCACQRGRAKAQRDCNSSTQGWNETAAGVTWCVNRGRTIIDMDIVLEVELVKLDVKNAQRNVPVDPKDRHLLGMRWRGQVYVDAALPFDLSQYPRFLMP